jgi:hypothetical protein
MTVTEEISYTPTATGFHLTGSSFSQPTSSSYSSSSQQSSSSQPTEALPGAATSSRAPTSGTLANLVIFTISLVLGSELMLLV